MTKPLRKATIKATALGIYTLEINGRRVGDDYFAPGFTSYKHVLQYDEYDLAPMLQKENELIAVVSGGWAVGRFTYSSKSKITCSKQAFLAEIVLEYEDGSKETIGTDSSWETTLEGNCRFADFYDGESYDASVDLNKVVWKKADLYNPRFKVNLASRYGPKVLEHEILKPIDAFPSKSGEEIIYDFGQNFAGIVRFKLKGKKGQEVRIRHSEIILNGELCLKSLRSAKATITYICRDGEQNYSPRLTYMGFRYIGVKGIKKEDIEIEGVALYSSIEQVGSFECSNPLLNKLQSNIVWSAKSNFVEIPTDCPQRDERMGWTGDISVFARTACYNFEMTSFLYKWLLDVKAEQGRGGGFPLVVPSQGIRAPKVATACWGDCCIAVPYALYLSFGDKKVLQEMYPTMKRFIKAALFWARLSGIDKYKRHIWKFPFQFGDWCAPYGGVMDWMKKGKWTATAYLSFSCATLSEIASILGKASDSAYYSKLSKLVAESYLKVFCDEDGKLKKPFQTGYVLPLFFQMAEGKKKETMAKELDRLVRENGYRLSTGFVGTPYLLFALADNGYAETAYKVLLQEKAPSWLYQVKRGASTTWEQWAILDEKGEIPDIEGKKDIPSFNHYAYGAVGDFLYRRVLGIEPLEGGYKSFMVSPLLGGGLTYAKGSRKTSLGEIKVAWKMEGKRFAIEINVPRGSKCLLRLPSGEEHSLEGGSYTYEEETR